MAKRKRISYLETKAKSISDEQGGDKDNVYLQLITREKQREAARRIKFTLGKLKGSGVTKVDILRPNGNTEELTTKTEIETACMEENNKKYTQTYNTPCIKFPLRRLLGFDGNTPIGRDILLGNFDAPGDTSIYTREFFRQLKYADLRTSKPKAIVSSKDFRNGWRK